VYHDTYLPEIYFFVFVQDAQMDHCQKMDEQALPEEKKMSRQSSQEKMEEKTEQQPRRRKKKQQSARRRREVTWADVVKNGSQAPSESSEEEESEKALSETESDKAVNLLLPHIMTFLNSSESDSDSDKIVTQVKPIGPISDATVDRTSLCYQLRNMAQKASEIEGRISTYNYRFSCMEMSNWLFKNEIEDLTNIISELRTELSLQSYDIVLYKNLVSYQEESRESLNSQLTFVTSQLMAIKRELTDATVAFAGLQQIVNEYKRNETLWV
jgi:hypothetical protein